MTNDSRSDATFQALIRFWRGQRGMSQLDLSLAADVSTRHLSFLETGRSRPSIEMVSLLGEVLDVPLRSRNDLMRAAGFAPRYPEPSIGDLLAGPLGVTIDALLDHGDPFPVVVLDRWYRVLRTNRGGRKLLGLAGLRVGPDHEVNLLEVLFDPSQRAVITNWDQLAGQVLRRLQRLTLRDPSDERMAALLAGLLETRCSHRLANSRPEWPERSNDVDRDQRGQPSAAIPHHHHGVRRAEQRNARRAPDRELPPTRRRDSNILHVS